MAIDRDKFLNSLKSSLSTSRIDQKLIYRKAKDFFNCNSEAHLQEILGDHFSDYAETSKTFIFREMGATKGIVDQISLVYLEKPERTFLNASGKPVEEKLSNYINKIYDNIGNSLFQMHEKLVNAMSHCSVLVSFDNDDDEIKVRLITPDNYDVIQDDLDYTKATAYYMSFNSQDDMTRKQDVTTFIYIDKDKISLVDTGQVWKKDTVINETSLGKMKTSPLSGAETDDNPYKIIPIVTTASQQQVNVFFVDQNGRLFVTAEQVLITKDVSANKTAFNQGFSQLVKTQNGKGVTASTISDGMKISPDVVVILENGVAGGHDAEKLEYANSGVNLTMLNDDVKDTYLQTASIFGLGESDGNVKANASGLSLVVSDDKKNKLINASRPTYVKFEDKLFNIIRIINNVESSTIIPDDITLNVDFQEIVTDVGLQDKIDQEQHDIDNNLRSRTKILIDRNPELTQELAEQQVITAIKEELKIDEELKEMTNPDNKEPIGEDEQ